LSSKPFLEVFVVDDEEAVGAIVEGVKAVAIVVVAVGVVLSAEEGLVGVVKAVAVAMVVVGVEAFVSSTSMPLKNYEL
jgi:hypothetical protein